ncbi:hypothetical protein TRFO_07802 [Tritrichomonas foetus]|uniref:Uncharacterized protein n=1 Tax=Tritrichomonas foetus TaxID=1144522 RepID=A0A1J4JU80_9EUKA|nr:hypothetical protein TRFO_07802 [Tritrichomonas foetus]|eukprot:OHT00813.1 hypothetical protein TRFO_07802 [Tritrichomonas foetus]
MSDTELILSVLTAIKNDDVNALETKIKEGIPKDIKFPPELDSEPTILQNGAPFICVAAYFGSVNCLKYLISNGWDPNIPDDDGMSVSFYAAAAGKVDVIKLLIDLKIEVNGCGQATIRHHQLESFKQLLELNIIKINDTDFWGSTYLHIAAFECDIDAVKYLISQENVNINAVDKDGVFYYLFIVHHFI